MVCVVCVVCGVCGGVNGVCVWGGEVSGVGERSSGCVETGMYGVCGVCGWEWYVWR